MCNSIVSEKVAKIEHQSKDKTIKESALQIQQYDFNKSNYY